MKSGIYKITHIETGKCYVGSSVDIDVRWGHHRRELRKNIHHSSILQCAWNVGTESAFEFAIIESVDVAALVEREQFWIEALEAYGSGYNMTPFAYSNRGGKRSAETRAKMSAWQKGKPKGPLSVAHRAKLSLIRTGRSPSIETRAKMSASMKRRGAPKITQEQRARSNITKRGAKRTADQKERISAGLRAAWARRLAAGWKESDQCKEQASRLLAANVGSKRTSEQRARMSAAHKARPQRNAAQPLAQVPGRAANGKAFSQVNS